MLIKPVRTPPRLLRVEAIEQVTPLLRRIILGGKALKDFPIERFGGHIKVFLPRPGQDQIHMPELGPNGPVWPPADKKPIVRTYSVRYFNVEKNQLAVDFVMHGHKSFASEWASQAKVGDPLGIAGPGGPLPLITPADFHIIAGDLSAIPAISALLENLPEYSTGHVFVEVVNEDQVHKIDNKTNLQIHWLIQNEYYDPGLQKNTIADFHVPEGLSLSAWVAGESASVVCVRDFLREKYGLTKKELYAVPYWKKGNTEEEYHHDRHAIMDEEF